MKLFDGNNQCEVYVIVKILVIMTTDSIATTKLNNTSKD